MARPDQNAGSDHRPPPARRAEFARSRGAVFRLLLGLLFLAVAPGLARAQPISKEYQLKAAFLYNFPKFVAWPATSFADESSPIVIAVLGKNPFNEELSKLARSRTVAGRPIEVRFLRSTAEIRSAHIVFVGEGQESLLPGSVYGEPGLLTVGESAEFARRGGVITFTVIDEKVRFEIHQGSAEQAGLKLSGQLLKLATVIRKAP